MLAATSTLKLEQHSSSSSLQPSALSRVSGARIFSKFSNAWDRLQFRSPSIETKLVRDSPKSSSSDSLELQLGQPFSPIKTASPPLSTFQMRLNEGQNLNKAKVQKIVGGSVCRKPVPASSFVVRPLRDTTLDPNPNPTPQSLEDTSSSVSYNFNSFEFEPEFEDNLKDSVLKTSPTASSTPKMPCLELSTMSTPHRQNPSLDSISELNLDLLELQLLNTSHTPILTSRSQELHSLASSTSYSHDPKIREIRKIITREGERKKKHPSPSKHDLEELEIKLKRYGNYRRKYPDDDKDELSNSYLEARPALSLKNANRALKITKNVSTNNDFNSKIQRYRNLHKLTFTSNQGQEDCYREIRTELRYRRPPLSRDEIDELCLS